MAAKVMLGRPVESYPDAGLPADYVGIKVPPFSFSRLSGADPVLGVEMASTGEVACFGRNKYEAYLKALISTGIVPPKKIILFSCGRDNIFLTPGTADFLTQHNVPCKYLETLVDGQDQQKSGYSLTQHLANNLIDAYQPAVEETLPPPRQLQQQGYHTRRLAVDFAVPLITNVKIAKLLAEALVRNLPLEASSIDSKSASHANVPWTCQHLCICPGRRQHRPHPDDPGFRERWVRDRDGAGQVASSCLTTNSKPMPRRSSFPLTSTQRSVDSIFAAHFTAWPSDKPIVTDAKDSDLTSIILLANLDWGVHVTDLCSQDDVLPISLSKAKQLKVTCNVSVYSIFFSRYDYPQCAFLPSADDQKALRQKLKLVDAFSVGVAPFGLALALHEKAGPNTSAPTT
uniref:Aspartate carbamoyltransferase n=1 Tax=Mycena chlorophos TaxID=658473 RepID=A0ABQ0KVT5_MYCCL|nr:aspartate carbamoyltransferase [Mycena chlorophos]